MKAHAHSVRGHELQACIDACTECHQICEDMIFNHCLRLGGKHVESEHLKLMTDCAEICQVSANFMLRGSERHQLICGVCAEICEACAEDCERVGEMEECVTACRKCAQTCREMVA